MRVLVALGGNAMTGPDGSARAEDQRAAVAAACEHLARLVEAGHEVVITHGNGPQVGNILRKNELAAEELPMVGLDWCGAQTQGTLGFTVVTALEATLRRRGLDRRVVALVTRTLVDDRDPAFHDPVKPIGGYRDAEHAQRMTARGQRWKDFGARGWRRVVPSPEPLEVLETSTVLALVDGGWLVVAAGGGGIPVVADGRGGVRGVEAVVDKDLTAARLALSVGADVLVIATDVEHAVIGWGTPRAEPVRDVAAARLRELVDEGHFASGSMGPKTEALLRFVEQGGQRAVVTTLDRLDQAVDGRTGTSVTA